MNQRWYKLPLTSHCTTRIASLSTERRKLGFPLTSIVTEVKYEPEIVQTATHQPLHRQDCLLVDRAKEVRFPPDQYSYRGEI